jgi:hypothetical protein
MAKVGVREPLSLLMKVILVEDPMRGKPNVNSTMMTMTIKENDLLIIELPMTEVGCVTSVITLAETEAEAEIKTETETEIGAEIHGHENTTADHKEKTVGKG